MSCPKLRPFSLLSLSPDAVASPPVPSAELGGTAPPFVLHPILRRRHLRAARGDAAPSSAAPSSAAPSMISSSSASSVAESLSIDSADHYPPRRRLIFEHNHPWFRCFARCSPQWCWPSGLRASDLADLDRRSTALEWSNVFSDDSVSASALSAPSDVASCSSPASIRRPILSWPPLSAAGDTQQMEMSSTRLFTS